MTRSTKVKLSKLPVRFTRDYTCHTTAKSIFGIRLEERWKKKKFLGKGSYGEVWLQQCTTNNAPGRLRAVKKISKVSSSDTIDYARELEAIARFSEKEYARYFVRSSGWYEDNHSVFIAMEYVKLGDLQQYLGRAIPEVEAQRIAFQLLEALWFMHKDGFAHRDLKPANIFVVSMGPDWWVKVGDFGVSKRFDQGLTALRTVIGTPNYLAPEMLEDQQRALTEKPSFSYTSAVDIWSVGIITFYMLTGRLPFPGITGLLKYTVNPDGSPFRVLQHHGVTEAGEEFIKGLLCVAPSDRLSAEEALHHSWRGVVPVPRTVSFREGLSSASLESIEPSGRWSALGETGTRSDKSSAGPSKNWSTMQVPMQGAPNDSATISRRIHDAFGDDIANATASPEFTGLGVVEARKKTLAQSHLGKGPGINGSAQSSKPPSTAADPLPDEPRNGSEQSSSRERDTKTSPSSRHAVAAAPKPRAFLRYVSQGESSYGPLLKINGTRTAENASPAGRKAGERRHRHRRRREPSPQRGAAKLKQLFKDSIAAH